MHELHHLVDHAHAGRRVEAMGRKQLEKLGMAMGERAERVHHLPQPCDRVARRRSRREFDDHMVDECVEQMCLARKIVVHAHRLAAERGPESADTERREPVLLDHRQRSSHNPRPSEGRRGRVPATLRRRWGAAHWAMRLNYGSAGASHGGCNLTP